MEHKSRSDELGQLDAFVSEKMKLLSNVLSTLGWDESSLENNTKVQCPKDSNHWVPESSLPKHLETCAWVKEGYIKDEKDKLPSSSKFFYERASAVDTFNLDKETVLNVLAEKGLLEKKPADQYPDLPQTYERWTAYFTSKQRLALYDYVNQRISESQPKTLPIEDLMFDFEKKDNQDEKPKSHLEILAEQRDYKRRRQSYRAKNVHITKKSYTEVIKEVIENQISFLAETRKIETEEKDPASPKIESESQREESNQRSRSHTPKKKQKKHKKDWSRSRSRSKSREELSHRSRSHSPKRKQKKHKKDRIISRSRSKSIEESNHRSRSRTPKKKQKKHKKYWSRSRSGSRSKSREESNNRGRSCTPKKKRKKHKKDWSRSRSRSISKSGEESHHRRRSCTPKKKRKKHKKDRSRSKSRSKSGDELSHRSHSCTPKKKRKKHKKDRSRSKSRSKSGEELSHRSSYLTPKKKKHTIDRSRSRSRSSSKTSQ